MYDSRYPNLVRIESCGAPPSLKRAVKQVCSRAMLEAAFDARSGSFYFHIPGSVSVGVWRESVKVGDGWLGLPGHKTDSLVSMLNSRKMPEIQKLREMAWAEESAERAAEQERGKDNEEFGRHARDILRVRRSKRGMHSGYRKSVVVKPGA